MKNLICAMSIALAAGVALAEDLTVSENMTITNAATYGTITFENNATLTLKQGDKQYLTFGTMSGTGKIVMDGRAYIRSSASGVDGVIPETVTIEVKGTTSWANRLTGGHNGHDLIVEGPLVGNGDIYLNYTDTVSHGVVLKGDNSGFEGTVYLDDNSNVRNKFGAAQAGGTKMRFVNLGNASDNGSVTFNGDSEGKTTLYLGSVYTSSRTMANYPWRFKNSGIITLETGHLNRTDDRISILMGEYKETLVSGNVRIRKVGTGTLELWNVGHRYGTFIDNGTVLVTSDRALNLYASDAVVTFGSDTNDTVNVGGTLKYGEDPTVTNAVGQSTPVTTDYSSNIKNSYGFISVDTGTNIVTWASEALQTQNPDSKGIVKKGDGELILSSYKDATTAFLASDKYTNRVEGGVLSFRNGRRGYTPDFASKILGTGTLRLSPFEDNGGFRIRANGALDDFEGTLEWGTDQDQSSKAIGFLTQGSDVDLNKLRFRITGDPAEAIEVIRSEANQNKVFTFGAFDHLHPNAKMKINNHIDIVIAGTHGDSYMNGTYTGATVDFIKNGSGKLTIGSGFTVVEGSAFAVNAGTLELENGVTQPSYMTIAEGVTLCGEGTFGTVDLSKHDLVLPTEVDKDQKYTILTATSVSGDYTQNVKDALAALGDKRWHLRKVTSDGTTKIVLAYSKNGLTIIIR